MEEVTDLQSYREKKAQEANFSGFLQRLDEIGKWVHENRLKREAKTAEEGATIKKTIEGTQRQTRLAANRHLRLVR